MRRVTFRAHLVVFREPTSTRANTQGTVVPLLQSIAPDFPFVFRLLSTFHIDSVCAKTYYACATDVPKKKEARKKKEFTEKGGTSVFPFSNFPTFPTLHYSLETLCQDSLLKPYQD